MKSSVSNFVLSQICWFGCVLGGARSILWLGPSLTLLFAATVVKNSEQPRREALFLMGASVLGTVGDRVVVGLGAYGFAAEFWAPWGYPLWMTSLWLAFAATFGYSLSWLSERYMAASLFGLIGGPLAYSAGAALGAIQIGPGWQSKLGIGLFWALIMPALFGLRNALAQEGSSECHSSLPCAERV